MNRISFVTILAFAFLFGSISTAPPAAAAPAPPAQAGSAQTQLYWQCQARISNGHGSMIGFASKPFPAAPGTTLSDSRMGAPVGRAVAAAWMAYVMHTYAPDQEQQWISQGRPNIGNCGVGQLQNLREVHEMRVRGGMREVTWQYDPKQQPTPSPAPPAPSGLNNDAVTTTHTLTPQMPAGTKYAVCNSAPDQGKVYVSRPFPYTVNNVPAWTNAFTQYLVQKYSFNGTGSGCYVGTDPAAVLQARIAAAQANKSHPIQTDWTFSK